MDWGHRMEWRVDLDFEMERHHEKDGCFDLEVESNLC